MMNRSTLIPYAALIVGSCWLLYKSQDRHEIGYYGLLRFAVCAACIYSAILARRLNLTPVIYVAVTGAILFNPLLPIHLKREEWKCIDIPFAASLAVTAAVLIRNKRWGTA